MSSSSRSRRSLVILGAVGLSLVVAAPANARSSIRSGRTADVSPAVSVVAPNIIGFESDPQGIKPDGFASRDNPTVHFVDTLAADLQVFTPIPEGNGQPLVVFGDDASALVILFDVPTTRLSILFGNDDPNFSLAGDRATLTVFRNGQQVARRHVTMNRNDLADQTIQYQGRIAIDRATLIYNRAGTPLNLAEVVDDITLSQICTIRGNNRRNRLAGNVGPNGICGLNGADRIFGNGGNDALFGGGGRDRINGNDGNDLVVGGNGDDTLNTADGVFGNDAVYGGPGIDTCTTDQDDLQVGCENVVIANRRPSARRR